MWPEKLPRPSSAMALRASKPESTRTIAVSHVPSLPASRAFEIKTPASRASPSPPPSCCPPARASPSLFFADGARPPLSPASSLSLLPLAPLPSPPAALPLAPLALLFPSLFFVDDASLPLPPSLSLRLSPLPTSPSVASPLSHLSLPLLITLSRCPPSPSVSVLSSSPITTVVLFSVDERPSAIAAIVTVIGVVGTRLRDGRMTGVKGGREGILRKKIERRGGGGSTGGGRGETEKQRTPAAKNHRRWIALAKFMMVQSQR